MTSQPSNERENSIRRETAFRLEKILRSKLSYNNWLPLYEIEMNTPENRKYLFVALDSKKKGKKRIYTTRGATPSAHDLFICYMSRKDIRRLDARLGPRDRELKRQKRMDIFADKWVLTKGKPATDIRAFSDLWHRFRAVEIDSSKANRPPEGSIGLTYAVNADYLPDLSAPLSSPKIVCRLKRLHKGDVKDGRRSYLGMH